MPSGGQSSSTRAGELKMRGASRGRSRWGLEQSLGARQLKSSNQNTFE